VKYLREYSFYVFKINKQLELKKEVEQFIWFGGQRGKTSQLYHIGGR
jgi:hypothetical protein